MDEQDYFGLQYIGSRHELLWLNMRNRLTKQLTTQPYNLYLRVKFYISPHMLLLEETRHQFYLNVARQLKGGVWDHEVTQESQGHMIALMTQAEFGNFNITTTPCKYACFWPDNRDEMPADVIRIAAEYHRTLVDISRSHIEYELLRFVQLTLELYGTLFYEAKDCFESKVLIGVGPEGVYLCSDLRQVLDKHPFGGIQKTTVSSNVVSFTFIHDDATVKTLGYRLVTNKAANSLYRCVTEMNSFFRCDTVRSDVMEQTCRDFKGTLASTFLHHNNANKDYAFDIIYTSREVYDHARRRLHSCSTNISPPPSPFDPPVSTGADSSSKPDSQSGSGEAEVVELRSKLERIKDAHMCRVCMDKSINRVFFPCGHSVCCEVCAERLDECCWCRRKIDIRHPLFLPFAGDDFPEMEDPGTHTAVAGAGAAVATIPSSQSLTPTASRHQQQASRNTLAAPARNTAQMAPEIASTETLTDLNVNN